MNRRIFIAINLPAEARATIREVLQADAAAYTELYEDARMTPERDWHITLLFLGDQPEDAIPAIERVISEVMQTMPLPALGIRMFTTAPPHRPPRMIWATTSAEANEYLGALKESIKKALAQHGIRPQGEQFARFNGHITLARLPEGRRIADHTVALAHTITFQPNTIDLMESQLDRAGAEYGIIRSIPSPDPTKT